MEQDILVRYYMEQAGSGIGEFYSGPIYQRGHGIGSFLGGLFKTVLPILKRGGAAVGREVLKNGTNFLNDVQNNVNPQTALKNRARETVDNLKRKLMYGEGFIGGHLTKKRQLGVKPRAVKIKKNIKKKKVKRNNKVKSKKVVKRKKKSGKKKKYKKKNADIFSF